MGATIAMPMGTKAETRVARQLYLFGNGDGKRITAVERISELSGIHPNTIRKHLPNWEREFEETVAGKSELGLQLLLSQATLQEHKAHVESLRQIAADAKAEHKLLPKLVERAEELLAALLESTENTKESARAIKLFELWLRAHGEVKAARTHYVAMHRAWKESAGIDSLQAVAETREKALATGRAKMQLRDEAGPADPAAGLPPAEVGGRAGAFIMEAPKPAEPIEVEEWEGV